MKSKQNREENILERAERSASRSRRPIEYAGLAARGFCMGAADVVPGVSGGTMAFILGIYEELIQSIRQVAQPEFLRAVLRFRIREVFTILNWKFLLAVVVGIFSAILTLARAIEWLLATHPTLVWSFFFGLVFASVLVVSKRISRWRMTLWLALVAGTAGAYLLVGLVPLQTPDAPWFLFLSGAVAICAMILPGISGAFILVLLGKYQYVLSAVNERDVAVVLWVGAGAIVGIVTFAQILGWLFRRYHDATVAVLTGFMLGSLRKVWPWKIDLEWMTNRHGERIPTVQHNVLPDAFTTDVLVAVALAITGLLLVLLLDWWASRLGPDMQPGT
jgi:putative membrane protein